MEDIDKIFSEFYEDETEKEGKLLNDIYTLQLGSIVRYEGNGEYYEINDIFLKSFDLDDYHVRLSPVVDKSGIDIILREQEIRRNNILYEV